MSSLELKIPPVVLVIVVGAGMWGLTLLFPTFAIPIGSTTSKGIGVVLLVAGISLALLGVLEFRKSSTTVDPRFPDKSSQLVTTGVYRISRNPMYLGFLVILLGWSLYLVNYIALLLLPAFVAYMTHFQIKPEERVMAQKFSGQFSGYTARVRRWI